MRLWTFHKDGFSIVDDDVDPRRSGYARKYPNQYAKLWAVLGTQQLIWCVTNRDDWPIKDGYEEWELEVAPNAFLRIVNDMVWNGILGEQGVPKRLYDQIEDEVRGELLDDDDINESVIARIEVLRNPFGDPWEQLFVDNVADCCSSVLLKGRIPEEWIVKKPI